MSTRLFVGNLPWTVCKQQLKEYFSQFGRVIGSSVNFDKNTGFSKGFGFVKFDSEESLSSVIALKHHELEGRKLNIHLAEDSWN